MQANGDEARLLANLNWLVADRALRLGGIDHRLLGGGLGEGRACGDAESRNGRDNDEEFAERHLGQLSRQNRLGFSMRRSCSSL